MKFLIQRWRPIIFLAWAVAIASPAEYAEIVPAHLRQLAARSARREAWPELRAYAQSTKNSEWRGWAFFVLGYQEYEAQHFGEAAEDLDKAAETRFPLADYGAFYKASAASRMEHALEAAEALKGFGERFPQSHLRWQALELQASSYLEVKMPQEALDALLAAPEVRKRPLLALLLAQAYQQANRTLEAVSVYQDIYFAYPTAPEAKVAAEALAAIRRELGPAYPAPTEELRTSRAELLFRANRYEDARKEFDDLLRDQPSSSMAPQWQLGRARCLLSLRRTPDAAEALFTHFATPELEARRLAVLVQVHARQTDAAAVAEDLRQLEALGTTGPARADALSAAGMFYYRQLNWQEATQTYQRLLDLYPESDHIRADGWRLVWCDYLLHDPRALDVMRDHLRRFPDSPRAAAILYWLGRGEEEQGTPTEARALYALLRKRFVHSYYARQALARLSSLRAEKETAQREKDPEASSFAATLASTLPTPALPAGLACPSDTPSDAARPAAVLESLGLNALAQGYIKEAIAEGPVPADVRLLLARMEAENGHTSDALFAAARALPAYPQVSFSELSKEFWNLLYPQAFGKLILRQARINHLDPSLVFGIVRQESAFNPKALSTANARGLMQVLPETATRSHRPSSLHAAGRRLYDPAYNVRVGCAYLSGLSKMFDNRPEYAVAAYHAGDVRVRDWMGKFNFPDSTTFLESIPIPATRVYVEAVMRDAEVYKELMSGSAHFAVCTGATNATNGARSRSTTGKRRTPSTAATKRRANPK